MLMASRDEQSDCSRDGSVPQGKASWAQDVPADLLRVGSVADDERDAKAKAGE